MKQFIVTINYGNRTKRARVSAEDETKAKAITLQECYESDIISVREAAYLKLTPEEVAQKRQDRQEDKNWQKDIERLERKGALLSDFKE